MNNEPLEREKLLKKHFISDNKYFKDRYLYEMNYYLLFFILHSLLCALDTILNNV